MDWIQGEKFFSIADFIYTPINAMVKDDYYHLHNTFDINKLFDGCIIYTHTMYVRGLLALLKPIKTKVIIITHNSDDNIDELYIPAIPPCVIKWYTQNVNCNDSRIESIPIGLENNRWFPKIHKKEKMLDLINSSSILVQKNLIYVNHNVCTNPYSRKIVYKILKEKPWATVVDSGKNGSNFDQYLINIYNHKFVACPEGNGIDTHRIWECLYLGTIPIVIRNYNPLFYKDLPICFIDDWKEVTEAFLKEQYEFITKCNIWNLEKLQFKYWENKIKNTKV
jgi:hypothetical protein